MLALVLMLLSVVLVESEVDTGRTCQTRCAPAAEQTPRALHQPLRAIKCAEPRIFLRYDDYDVDVGST